MRGEDGNTWVFQAEALCLCDPVGACRGHWYDSRGVILPVVAVASSDRVNVEWGDATTEVGRTSHVLVDGGLRITDEVRLPDGQWKVFGIVTAKRTEP